MISGAKLRFARQARGFSQQQLAGMAGVSRQAVSAVESGQSDPSLRVALALAQALGMTVDELFGAEGAIPTVSARLVSPVASDAVPSQLSARVTLAPIGDSFVALPLAGPTVSRAGFLPAGGLLASDQQRPARPARRRDRRGWAADGAPQRTSGPSGHPGPRSSSPAATRRCRCSRNRLACSTRRSRSAGGRARAGRRCG